jgi:phosphomevalonate kinase
MKYEYVQVSAPGKILLIGAYSVLEEGNISYTLAINKRVRTKIEKGENEKIKVHLKDFGIKAEYRFDGENLKPCGEIKEDHKKVLTFTENCLKLSLRYMNEVGELKPYGFKFTTKNDEGFTYQWGKSKSGFGSSAAFSVSGVGAVFEYHDFEIEEYKDDVHKMAQLVNIFSQNKIGSGFDIATSTFGCTVWRRFPKKILENLDEEMDKSLERLIKKSWGYTREPIGFPKELDIACAFTGKAVDTRELVKGVNEYKKKDPEGYDELVREINYYNELAVVELRYLAEKFSEEHLEKFVNYFNKGWELTKELGSRSEVPISTEEFDKYCELAVKAGAYCAKLPGAGGGDSVVAIYPKNSSIEKRIYDEWEKVGIKPLPFIKISKKGVKRDV